MCECVCPSVCPDNEPQSQGQDICSCMFSNINLYLAKEAADRQYNKTIQYKKERYRNYNKTTKKKTHDTWHITLFWPVSGLSVGLKWTFLADRTIGRAYGTVCHLSSVICDILYSGETAVPICMKFSGKVWSDHGTTWLHFGSIRVNRAMPRC